MGAGLGLPPLRYAGVVEARCLFCRDHEVLKIVGDEDLTPEELASRVLHRLQQVGWEPIKVLLSMDGVQGPRLACPACVGEWVVESQTPAAAGEEG